MKEPFIIWITLQLMMIGAAGADLNNRIVNKTYDCKREVVPVWFGIIFPLAFFVPANPQATRYCEGVTK